jgi:cytochrome P450
MNATQLAVPAHVPAQHVVDFDFASPPGAEHDVYRAWATLQGGPALVWTPHYGGHWIATRAAAIEDIQSDHEHFSHEEFTLPRRGNMRPRVPPLEYDPPLHTEFRRILNPALSPVVVNGLENNIRELCIELIESFRSRGHCDFVEEFGHHLPTRIFLRLASLPEAERVQFMEWGEVMVRSTDEHVRMETARKIMTYLSDVLAERRQTPGTDLMSRIVKGHTVSGRPMTATEELGMATLAFVGGLDTVASLMGFSALALANAPKLRQRLVTDPAVIPKAVDELLRRHGLSNTTRLVTQDHEFHGARLKKGDLVMVPISLHGLDPLRWDNPWDVEFDRDTRGLATFGNGPHRCVGATLARAEMRIFLEEWLKRIPEFRITDGESPRMVTGSVNSLKYLPLSWDASS